MMRQQKTEGSEGWGSGQRWQKTGEEAEKSRGRIREKLSEIGWMGEWKREKEKVTWKKDEKNNCINQMKIVNG